MGGKWFEKKLESKNSWTLFFSRPFPPHVWDSVFFQCTKTASALDTPSCNFSEPGFWILTKGGRRQPVVYQPYPNSIQVCGMEQPTQHHHLKPCLMSSASSEAMYYVKCTIPLTLACKYAWQHWWSLNTAKFMNVNDATIWILSKLRKSGIESIL